MGALTSNRKRGEDYFTFNYKSPALNSPNFDHRRIDTNISKKPKYSPSMQSTDQSLSSKDTLSRLHRYPEPLQRFRREVHAPCRAPKFGFTANSRPSGATASDKGSSADKKGNVLEFRYEKAKKTALDTLRFFKKDKEVIEVDDTETVRDDNVSDNSSIEEVEVVEDGREGQYESSKEISGVLANLQKSEWKGVEYNFVSSSSSAVSYLTKVDSAGKMLDSLSLNDDLEIFRVPSHKKLLDSAERRNGKLSSLSFEIKLHERRLSTFQLLRSPNKQEKDLVTEPFVPLTKEEKAEVAWAFASSNRRKVLVAHDNSNIEITVEKMQCLRPGAWLNDEVINLYLELLKEREKREPKKFLKCHFFNTFFYKKLISGGGGYDFKAVRRWTTQKKLGYCLLECEKMFVPIHKEVHWCLAVINKKDAKFQYLDSLGGIDNNVLKVLAKYFVDEVKDKSGKDIDVSSWKQEFVEDLPEQKNGFDCGMFMIKYADFYSRDVGLCFNQEHMPYFRQRTAKEILKLKAE